MIKIVILHIILCTIFHKTTGIIYRLNESEYNRMPPVNTLDDYELCLSEPESLYCTTEVALVADEPSPLLELIQEYSEDTTKHFNHTLLYRGVCVTRTCKKFHTNTTLDLKVTLEACLNESLWHDYQLKARVIDVVSCSTAEHKKISLTAGDIAVAVICFGILLINVVGSLCDVYCTSDRSEHVLGMRMLLYFSIRRNWKKLVAPPADGPEPRLKRLKIFYFLRSLATLLVLTGHAMITCVIYISNPYFVENLFNKLWVQSLLSGTVLIQAFFIMSGFLLTYNLKLYAEKHEVTWKMLPMGIMLRYLRLTPPYALMIALVCTWLRHLGSGPLWTTVVELEIDDCQRFWWYHLLYINNYVDGSQCFQQAWYLAADTQLYVLGIIVCVAFKTNKSRKVVLSVLAIAGIVFPAMQLYIQDLNNPVFVKSTAFTNFFVNETTFDNLYKRGHTNLFGYTIGLTLGLVVYHLQQTNVDIQKYRKYRLLYWCWLPGIVSWLLLGSIFYQDGARYSIIVGMLYASLSAPIFGGLVAMALMGYIFKYENLLRGFGEWRGWAVPSRLSYCAYMVHVTFLRTYFGTETTLQHSSILAMAQISLLTITVSFAAAVPLWLLLESPFGQLTKLMLPKQELEEPNGKDLEKQEKHNDMDISVKV